VYIYIFLTNRARRREFVAPSVRGTVGKNAPRSWLYAF